MSSDGYLGLIPNIWISAGLPKCLISALIPIWPRYNRCCHKGSVSGITWHVAATSARCLMNIVRGSLEVSFEGLNSSFLFRTVFLKPELCYWKYFMVMISPFFPTLVDLTHSLRVLFLEGKQQYWGVSGWLVAPITQLCQEPGRSRWEQAQCQSVVESLFLNKHSENLPWGVWKEGLAARTTSFQNHFILAG